MARLDVTRTIADFITDAHAAGAAEGRAAVISVIRELLDDMAPAPPRKAPARQTPNTVRPRILELVGLTPGLTIPALVEFTGFKAGSVRGTVSTLIREGLLRAEIGRLYPVLRAVEAS